MVAASRTYRQFSSIPKDGEKEAKEMAQSFMKKVDEV